MKPDELEKYSSATTLSDMEVFVFPELMYSLVLANIMSPLYGSGASRIVSGSSRGRAATRSLCACGSL